MGPVWTRRAPGQSETSSRILAPPLDETASFAARPMLAEATSSPDLFIPNRHSRQNPQRDVCCLSKFLSKVPPGHDLPLPQRCARPLQGARRRRVRQYTGPETLF
jgi:hypothetical protein